MTLRRVTVPFLATMMIAVAFAGCLQAETSGEPTISRVHTLTLSRATLEAADAHEDDPAAALREMLVTELVVRVEDAGEYTLEYLGADGTPKTSTLTLEPGTPATVSAADPLAPAVLKRGEETVSVRGGTTGAWWHVGDYPLGFNMTEGAKAKYSFTARAQEKLTLTDLTVEEQDIVINDLLFDLDIPMAGSASWELQPNAGNGMPLLVSGEMHIPADAGDLVTVDLTATQGGVVGTAGATGGVDEARASGSGKLWIENGQPVAAQFLGGDVVATPRATMWATGFFADLAEGMSCSGKTKAEGCQPSELTSFERAQPAGEKETFETADMPRSEDEDDRKAIELMELLFAQDIQPGDKGIIVGLVDRRDTEEMGEARFTFTIEAVDIESVTVPAGTFETIKIIEETRTFLDVDEVPGPDGTPVFRGLNLDETLARTTFWLDATTYQPVKLEASTPFNAEEILKKTLDAVDPSVWDQIGGKPIDNSQWTLTAVGESRYELVEHTPGARFSALVGLALAHGVTGTMAAAPASYLWVSGFGAGPTYEAQPAMTLSMTSAGPAADGLKSYTIAAASPDMAWGDLLITLDGMESYLEPAYEGCAAPEEGFTVCQDGMPADWSMPVLAGDVLTIMAEPGQTLRVLDPYSNSVIISLVVS